MSDYDLRKDYTDKVSKKMGEVGDHQIDPINHAPSNADLREAIAQVRLYKFVDGENDEVFDIPPQAVDMLVNIFQAQQQQLLTELMGEAVEVNTIQYSYDNGDKMIAGFTNSAVPVAAIEQKLAKSQPNTPNHLPSDKEVNGIEQKLEDK